MSKRLKTLRFFQIFGAASGAGFFLAASKSGSKIMLKNTSKNVPKNVPKPAQNCKNVPIWGVNVPVLKPLTCKCAMCRHAPQGNINLWCQTSGVGSPFGYLKSVGGLKPFWLLILDQEKTYSANAQDPT